MDIMQFESTSMEDNVGEFHNQARGEENPDKHAKELPQDTCLLLRRDLGLVKVAKKGGRGRKILTLLRAVVENQWIARRGSETMILRAATCTRLCSGSKRKYIRN